MREGIIIGDEEEATGTKDLGKLKSRELISAPGKGRKRRGGTRKKN